MMDIQLDQYELPEELERAITKHDAQDARKEALEGWGATTGGQALTQRYHERLTTAISVCLLDAHGGTDVQRLVATLRNPEKITPEVIALSVLQSILHSVGRQDTLRTTLLGVGRDLANELWAAKITTDQPELAAKIIKAVRARHNGTDKRINAARRAAFNAGYSARIWSKQHCLKAGTLLVNVALTALADVFELVNYPGNQEYAITLTDAGEAAVDDALDKAIRPVFWPSAVAPKPWDAPTGGGSWDERVNCTTTLVRSRHKSTHAAIRHAIKSGAMQPALDALNALQAVPFTINQRVLEVMTVAYHCEPEGTVPGFPELPVPMPKKLSDSAFERLSKRDKAISGAQRLEIRKHNSGLVSDRAMLKIDMVTAAAMAKLERFYTPMNLDWRGRVYALSSFNFQREDRVRALFRFADGMPIGVEGLQWLMIHTANCGDFKVNVEGKSVKISKRPLKERITWCSENHQLIGNIASAPLVHKEWMQAGEPWLFLAACFELTSALAEGPSFMTHLPTSYDGSCSGLQHLSAMTRAPEGSMVNLTPSTLPQDVYQQVADDTYERIRTDLAHQPDPDADDPEAEAERSRDIRAMAQLFMDYEGSWRDLAKRNVMTYSYSSKKFGMASQQQVDLMEPLSREVLSGKRAEHPFVGYQTGSLERPSKAARYIASHIFDAIEERIKLPAKAMHFLQSIAKAMAHEGKPVCWTTPAGLPWINRYHAIETQRVQLFLNDGGVRRKMEVKVATGDLKEIDKAKAANGVAPNFVHALDASHLLLTTNAAVAQDITSIATVHDSFGCLAPQAALFNQVIREEFKRMYETHDVLTEILVRATADLTEANHDRLPLPLTYGTLNLKDTLNAEFAFA